MADVDEQAGPGAIPNTLSDAFGEPDGGAPRFDRRAEVEALLEADQTFLGDVWRESQSGKTPAVLAEQWKITTGPIYSNLATARTLLEDRVPSGAVKAKQDAVACALGSSRSR